MFAEEEQHMDIITYVVGFLTALIGGSVGAILTHLYSRSRERRRRERDVIEEIYVQAIVLRKSIEPAIVVASTPNSSIQSTWVEPMIRMVVLSELYLPSLKLALEELNERIKSVEDAFSRASYEFDGSGHVTKKIMPGDFDQITESFKKSFTRLLTTLRELAKKRQ